MTPTTSYLVCSLPQSGAPVLAAALRATGTVPVPEPYFWAGWCGHDPCTRRQLRRSTGHRGVVPSVLHRVRDAATPNGWFGADTYWNELDQVLVSLRRWRGDGDRTDHDRLARFLPGLRYVHLTREDKHAQALAWWRTSNPRDAAARLDRQAVPGCSGPAGDVVAPRGPHPALVHALERRLRADEWRLVAYFTRAGIDPLVISYEDLAADTDATVARVLRYVGAPRGTPGRGAMDGGPSARAG